MEILLFILDKLITLFLLFFRNDVVVLPRSKFISVKGDKKAEYRYLIFISNKKDKPFYNLNLRIGAQIKDSVIRAQINPNFEGREYQPLYPLASGDPKKEPIVDFGQMGFFNADRKHFSYNLRIDHIDPKETKKYEIVLTNFTTAQKIRVKHQISFDNNPPAIEVKKEFAPGQVSISVQGLNWKIKK